MAPAERGSRLLVLAAVVAATAGAAAVLVTKPDSLARLEVVAADAPEVRIDREVNARFGMQNPVVWVVAARDGTIWTREHLATLQSLTRDTFRIPGVLAPEVVSIASPNVRDFRVSEDSLEPVYVMGTVPRTEDEVAALRRSVEGNENYHGTLVSLDGQAAMIVADFRAGADAALVARSALEIRDRYRNGSTDVWVSGGPVLAAVAARHVAPVAAGAAAILLVGLGTLLAAAGLRPSLAVAAATLLAPTWTLALVALAGAVVWPWTGYALLPIALAAAALAGCGNTSLRTRLGIAAALLAAFLVAALVLPPPSLAFATAGAVGAPAALLAGGASRVVTGAGRVPGRRALGAALLVPVLLAVAAALPGLRWIEPGFGLFGYGVRYLPAAASEDLRAFGRYFPPPTALAVRVRGEPGFVQSAEVLKAFDAVGNAVRNDPGVVRVLSLADLIKIVNRAFHENRPEYAVIPEEPGMVSRYLALAYSPGFRSFVDRAFAEAAIWVYLRSDDEAALARVREKIEVALAAYPVPAAEVDPIAGDGALVLLTAHTARLVRRAVLAAAAAFALALGILGGWRALGFVAAGGAAAAALLAGGMGWLGIPVDLVSLPFLAAAPLFGMTLASLSGARPLAVACGAAGLAALAIAAAASSLLAALLGVFLLAAVAGSSLSRPEAGR